MGFRKIIFKIKNDEMRYGTWHKGGHAKGIHATGHTNVWAQGCRWSCSVGAPFLGNCVIITNQGIEDQKSYVLGTCHSLVQPDPD